MNYSELNCPHIDLNLNQIKKSEERRKTGMLLPINNYKLKLMMDRRQLFPMIAMNGCTIKGKELKCFFVGFSDKIIHIKFFKMFNSESLEDFGDIYKGQIILSPMKSGKPYGFKLLINKTLSSKVRLNNCRMIYMGVFKLNTGYVILDVLPEVLKFNLRATIFSRMERELSKSISAISYGFYPESFVMELTKIPAEVKIKRTAGRL